MSMHADVFVGELTDLRVLDGRKYLPTLGIGEVTIHPLTKDDAARIGVAVHQWLEMVADSPVVGDRA